MGASFKKWKGGIMVDWNNGHLRRIKKVLFFSRHSIYPTIPVFHHSNNALTFLLEMLFSIENFCPYLRK
jgi:hypothetical protein